MKTLLTCLLVLAMTGAAHAQFTACYSWEDGGDALGCYNCDNTEYFNDTAHVSDGSASLAAADLGGSTPQIYVAWITGLNESDVVTATIDAYDESFGSNPSVRLWGHYTLSSSIDDYDGSTGTGSDYSGAAAVWENLSATWVMPAGKVALCIELRPYDSDPYGNFNWVDNLCITAPEGATVYFPGGTVPQDEASWGEVKALFR